MKSEFFNIICKGCFHILCCFSIIFTLITRGDFRCRYSLSAGGLGSLLSALHLRGLPQHAFPAGVSHLPLQSTSVRIGFLLKPTNFTKRAFVKDEILDVIPQQPLYNEQKRRC
ncbi:hypothetical protein HNP81_002055 [Peribacillus huizhouensis]|uniref:Uncharacterized protein n=1 Tax=Peribacillus huizhouensis TaxID=1501239 RepID=A0ABR6CP36_9BACI|nr:hypothetical protein [Peribacillus huizhouensis]